ncbi:methyltransferase domain-containing protein [Pseudoduganella sp. RAF53_2]|uniref:spermine/spermidine synthase domain-containing protein n=1 Tax=unclassified Pseudoduganella TaxID=2637179 RepID=UPI003F953A4B
MSSALSKQPQVRRRGRHVSLEFTPGEIQSQMDPADPYSLVLAYARAMMCFVLFKPRPQHIVMVGLGGGSLAKFCYRYLPNSRITVLELSEDVIALRERFKIPQDDERFKVIHADAVRYMPQLRDSADVLLVDGFDAEGLPPALTSARFYADCRRALRPDGVLVANMFSYDPRYPSTLARLRDCFQERICQFTGIAGNNRIVFAIRPGRTPGMPASRMQRKVAAYGGYGPGLGFALANRLLAHWTVARLRRTVDV